MADIFIGYRERDARRTPDVVQEAISERCPNNVFLDRESLRAGEWRKQIDDQLEKAKAFLLLIGPDWLRVKGEKGQQRLVDPEDVHRREIATALSRGIPVIPVLVGDADLPSENDLPDDIRSLARHEARTLGDTITRRRDSLELIFKDLSSAGIPVLPPIPPEPIRWPARVRKLITVSVPIGLAFLFFGWVSVQAFRWKLGVPESVRVSPAFYVTAARQLFLASSILAVIALGLLWVVRASGVPFTRLFGKVRRPLGRALHRLGDGPLVDISFLFAVLLLCAIVARYAGIFEFLMTTEVGDAYQPSVANDSYGAVLSAYITLIATMAALLASRLTERAARRRSFVLLGACIVTALFLAAVPYRLLVQNEAEEVGFPVTSTDTARAFVLDFGYGGADSVPLYIPDRRVRLISRSLETSLKPWRPPTSPVNIDSVSRRDCEIFGHEACRGVR